MAGEQTLEERLAAYRESARTTFRAMSDQALRFQDGVVVGGIDREELDREIARRRPVVERHVRMNDYVGPGRFATVTWPSACTREGGTHLLAKLGHDCVICHAQAQVVCES